MRFPLDKAQRKFGWTGLKGKVYLTKKEFPRTTAAFIEITGRHGKVKNIKSDIVYFVVSGNGEFFVNKKKFTVGKHDVVIVPRNTPYDYKALKGKLKLFLVHIPAFDPKYDKKLE